MSTPSFKNPEQVSLTAHLRGRVVQAKCGKSGVIHLVIGAEQKHSSPFGRLRQHVSNALFRAGDLCNPSQHNGFARVVRSVVPGERINDVPAGLTDLCTPEIRPLYLAGGDAYYNAFLVHEGVKHHNEGWLVKAFDLLRRKKGADDGHDDSLSALQSVHFPQHSAVVVNPIPQPDPELPPKKVWETATFAGGVLIAFAAALGLGALAAYENCPSEVEAMQQTALAVEDADAAARQIEADHLFSRRVQLAGDTVCLRTAGPGYRAVWSGPDETLHCVPKDQAQPKKDRLVLVAGGGL